MSDPTYDRTEINKNPEYLIAFILSELGNDEAPIGWSVYLTDAKVILQELKKNKYIK